MKHLICVALLVGTALISWASPLPTLQLVPSATSVTTGQNVTVDLNILGLGSPGSMEVGSFDSFITFDSTILSPTGVNFTLLLGDPSLFEAVTYSQFYFNYVEAADVSLLTVAQLDAIQPSKFTLATYDFTAIASGNIAFRYLGGPVDNGYGDLIAGTKVVLPEPSSFALLGSAVLGGGWWRIRRRKHSVKLLTVLLAAGLCVTHSAANAQICTNGKDGKSCDVKPATCDKPVVCNMPNGNCECRPDTAVSTSELASRPKTAIPVPISGWLELDVDDMPPFNPIPFGTPVTTRLPRDPSTIVVLPTSIVNSGAGDRGPFAMHNETTISVNPLQNDNYVYGANDYSPGDSSCGAYYSSDSAQTWTAQGTGVPLPTQPGYGAAGDPAVAFDTANNTYYSCLNFNRSNGNSAIYVFKSIDQGHTYGLPTFIASAIGSAGMVDKEYIATDPFTEKVYVSWTHFAPGFSPADIWLAGSNDGGVTFVSPPPHQINSALNRMNQGSVPTAGASANVEYVAWEDMTRPSIMVSKSIDGGFTFPGEVVVSTITALTALAGQNGVFRANSFPSIDVCRDSLSPFFGHVYVVWADRRNSDADIFLSRSIDGGVTWSAPVRVNDDPLRDGKDQFFPWMSIDPNCKINISFYDRRLDPMNQQFHVFMTDSTDDGMTFLPNVRVTTAASTDVAFAGTFIGDYTGLTSTNNATGTFHHDVSRAVPAWMDTTSGFQDVAAATALECGSSCGINIDLVLGTNGPDRRPGTTTADNIEVIAPGIVQVTAGFRGDLANYPQWPFWSQTGQIFDPTTNLTTFSFTQPSFPVQPGHEAHVGFVVVGNPTFFNVEWSHGGVVIGNPPISPVDFRYNMSSGQFAAIFCAPPRAKYPLKIQRLQFAAAELPVQLDDLNPTGLPGALAAQGTQLSDLTPPPIMKPGICKAVSVPGIYPKYKAMIFEADEVSIGDTTGDASRVFVQAIAGAEVRETCDVNADHQIDINDIRIIMNKLNTPAAPMNDPADADHDGRITANDARICSLACKNPGCAP